MTTTDKMRCSNCLGTKKAMQLGMMHGDCKLCKATGFIEKVKPPIPCDPEPTPESISGTFSLSPDEKKTISEPTKFIKEDIAHDKGKKTRR